MAADILCLVLRVVRESIEATGAPPDGLQDALACAEDRLRRSIGGSVHTIARVPPQLLKQRIIELAGSGLNPAQIRDRIGVSEGYMYRILRTVRQAEPPP